MLSNALGLAAGLTVAAVFAAAGLGKLRDRAGTRKAVGEFGAPDRLVAPVALLLPVAELVVAIALLFATTRSAGALGALVLLGVFSTAIGVSLARGRTPDCHCFGQLHSTPASWKTLVRNALLAGLAAVALVAGGPGAFGWIGNLRPVGTLALVAGAVAASLAVGGSFAFISLMRSHGRVLLRLDTVESALREAGIEVPDDEDSLSQLGIDPGSPAPAFAAETASEDHTSLDNLLEPGLPLLLLFTSPTCGPCQALLPDISRWQHEYADQLTIATLNGGEKAAITAEAHEHGLERVLIDHDLAVLESYQVTGTPSAVLVAEDGTIASYLASGSGEIEELVERVTLARKSLAACRWGRRRRGSSSTTWTALESRSPIPSERLSSCSGTPGAASVVRCSTTFWAGSRRMTPTCVCSSSLRETPKTHGPTASARRSYSTPDTRRLLLSVRAVRQWLSCSTETDASRRA